MGIGQIVNGTGTGALGQLMRKVFLSSLGLKSKVVKLRVQFEKEVDLFAVGTELSFQMLPYVDWTYPVLFEKIRIMVPYPEASQKSNALVAIYSKQVRRLVKRYSN
jgi:hypothetical protein